MFLICIGNCTNRNLFRFSDHVRQSVVFSGHLLVKLVSVEIVDYPVKSRGISPDT